jgi:hypothetical protein
MTLTDDWALGYAGVPSAAESLWRTRCASGDLLAFVALERHKVLAFYSRGLSTRDIEAHLREIYGVDVGRDLISRVTDEVMPTGHWSSLQSATGALRSRLLGQPAGVW